MTPILAAALIVLLIYYVRARREIRYLKNTAVVCANLIGGNDQTSENLRKFGKAASKAGVLLSSVNFPSVEPDDYADNDKDGVPDVFQRRKPLSEILEFEKDSVGHSNDYWTAIEIPPRPPNEVEYFVAPTGIRKAMFDLSTSYVIVKSVPGTNLDDLVDLTK